MVVPCPLSLVMLRTWWTRRLLLPQPPPLGTASSPRAIYTAPRRARCRPAPVPVLGSPPHFPLRRGTLGTVPLWLTGSSRRPPASRSLFWDRGTVLVPWAVSRPQSCPRAALAAGRERGGSTKCAAETLQSMPSFQ